MCAAISEWNTSPIGRPATLATVTRCIPALSSRTANAIAIASTQSSCVPDAALGVPSACRINVRHSFNNRGLLINQRLLASAGRSYTSTVALLA